MSIRRVISFANQKGGVGKTTCVASLGYELASKGRKVVLLDLDPQAHLTASFGFDPDNMQERGICEVLQGELNVSPIPIKESGELSLVPSNLTLAGVEFEIIGVPGREVLLRNYLKHVEADYILIDCPPSLGVLTLNALTASDEVFIPMQAEFLPLRGVTGLLDTITLVKDRLNPNLSVTGVIATRVNSRKILTRDVMGKIREYFGGRVFDTVIRENVSVAEAPAHEKTVSRYAPDSNGAADFRKLAKEVIEQEKNG